MRVRGLKLNVTHEGRPLGASHPMRVRGLKLGIVRNNRSNGLSHPMRVRGLKPILKLTLFSLFLVAPHAGAWIETRPLRAAAAGAVPSHPMRVRGLKHNTPSV